MREFLPHHPDPDKNSPEQGELFYGLIKFIKAKTIVEIGVDWGSTTRYLCQAAEEIGGFVYGYDCWADYGPDKSWHHQTTKENVESLLRNNGFSNFEMTKVDTFSEDFKSIFNSKHESIDFAFIDGDHSYEGIKSDFDVVYPKLSPNGIVAFHDTLVVDGCREYLLDLRSKFNDGTFDIIELPFGNLERRVGISILVKRSFPHCGIKIDAICGSNSSPEDIIKKEARWYKDQTLPSQFFNLPANNGVKQLH